VAHYIDDFYFKMSWVRTKLNASSLKKQPRQLPYRVISRSEKKDIVDNKTGIRLQGEKRGFPEFTYFDLPNV